MGRNDLADQQSTRRVWRAFTTLACVFALAVAVVAGRSMAAPAKGGPARHVIPAAEIRFARHVDAVIHSGNGAAINATIDLRMLVKKMTAGIPAPRSFQRSFELGFEKSYALGPGIAQDIAQGSTVTLLGVRRIDHQDRAVFRLAGPTGAFNYIEWVLQTSPNGKVEADDIYTAITGSLTSESGRPIYAGVVARQNRSFWQKVTGAGNNTLSAHLSAIERMGVDIKTGRYKDILATWKALPKKARRAKLPMWYRAVAAEKLQAQNPARFATALREFRKAYPNDPALDLLSLDALVSAGKYQKVIAALQRINAAVGGDPFLNMLSAAFEFKDHRPKALAQGQIYINEAMRAAPHNRQFYIFAITVALARSDYNRVTRLLLLGQKRFHIKWKNLKTVPAYAKYVKSPAYQRFLKAQAPAAHPTGTPP